MTIIEVDFDKNGKPDIEPEQVFYMLYPEYMSFWMKIKALILWIIRG